MIKKAKNILSLNSDEVFDFFMKSEQFHGFELPEYFDFGEVLTYVKKSIGNKPYEDCLSDVLPDDLPDVNLDILLNKDGLYAIRPLTLANPFLYYFLAREICSKPSWEAPKYHLHPRQETQEVALHHASLPTGVGEQRGTALE